MKHDHDNKILNRSWTVRNAVSLKQHTRCCLDLQLMTIFKAVQRDQNRCILTRCPDPEGCHIYPYCLLKKENANIRSEFWNTLGTFWSKDQIETWKGKLFKSHPDGETTANVISLRKDIHELWNKGYFALKPTSLSNDKKTLVITFYWQVRVNDEDLNLQTQPPSTRDLENNGDLDTYLTFRVASAFHQIKSGDTFTITTDDLVKRPLPSFELLRLQFFLQRIAGMAGAAEPEDLEEWGDDDGASDGAGIEPQEELKEEEELEEDCGSDDLSSSKSGVSPAGLMSDDAANF